MECRLGCSDLMDEFYENEPMKLEMVNSNKSDCELVLKK